MSIKVKRVKGGKLICALDKVHVHRLIGGELRHVETQHFVGAGVYCAFLAGLLDALDRLAVVVPPGTG